MGVPDHLAVRETNRGDKGLFATRAINKKEIIFTFIGKLVPLSYPDPKALQVSETELLSSTVGYDDFLNHSCEPNCYVRFGESVELVALRPIEEGEELSFNYNTTEYEMMTQGCHFACSCASRQCQGEVRGFAYLSLSEQKRLRRFLSPYLLKKLSERIKEQKAATPDPLVLVPQPILETSLHF